MAYKTHITIQGETWDVISLKYYGTEKNASLLSRANQKHISVMFFSGGVTLRIPELPGAPQSAIPAPPWKRQAK